MNLKRKPSIAAIATAVVVFNFSSCKYEDGPSISLRTKTSRLTGEWEATFINGQSISGDDINFTLEFEKDGDLLVSTTYSYYGQSYTETYKGDWEWEDGKEKIEITLQGDKTEWEITRLTNKEFQFEDEDKIEYEFEKK